MSLTVGRHKQTEGAGAVSVRQDGFITAILLLVYVFGLSLAVIISRYLSQARVEHDKVQPYAVELFLIILLLPGFGTIFYAFNKRSQARVVRHRQTNGGVHLHELLEEAGLYIFATCSIAFDIFVLSAEVDCLGLGGENSAVVDGVIDAIFYFMKIMFTICQCLFIRKFQHSRFNSHPLLQVFLVSIITSNLAAWIYTVTGQCKHQILLQCKT